MLLPKKAMRLYEQIIAHSAISYHEKDLVCKTATRSGANSGLRT